MVDLSGKVALVTGAGGGLGRAYALLLAQKGAKVVVNDYGGTAFGERGDSSRAQAVVDEIVSAGGEAVADAHDVSNYGEVRKMVDFAVKTYGTVHILINSAGVVTHGQPGNVDETMFRRAFDIATLGTILTMSAVWPVMEEQKYGRIINTSSAAIFGFGTPSDSSYASSKAAVFAMTREFGMFSEQFGIKVNGLLPEASTRLSSLSPLIDRLTKEKGFEAEKVAPFALALACEECPVSGEMFAVGGGRAARVTFVSFPGAISDTAEGFLNDWNQVMGTQLGDGYLPASALDSFRYAIHKVSGQDPGFLDPRSV